MSGPEQEDEELCYQEEVKDVRGFFKGIFREPPERRGEDIEEQGKAEGYSWVRDGKLFGQDYDKLKEKCLGSGQLWTDERFPPERSSLLYSSPTSRETSFQWLRPHQLCNDPRMVVDGADRFDINQGKLADCWLIAAISSLAMDPQLLHQVMDHSQSFQKQKGYCGIFRFKFWQYGEWVEVVVDDYLPCIDGKLAYMQSDSKTEFWSALLEKAYAKLHGSYQALDGGVTTEAMVDFTGGCSEVWDLSKPPKDLFTIMLKGCKRRSLFGCSINPDPNVHEMKTEMGLVRGHAYSMSKVAKAEVDTGLVDLVRVRNPWGNEIEWKGTWADMGKMWGHISDEKKKEMGITFEHDGEWWMSYKDFVSHFDQLEMCSLSPASLSDSPGEEGKWWVTDWHGKWVGETCGGCGNNPKTFAKNPQYMVTLEDVDEDDEDDQCTLILSLMQKVTRHEGVGRLSIGFSIYLVKDPSLAKGGKLKEDFFNYNGRTAGTKVFINKREVTLRCKLDPGTYLIVPSTFKPGHEGEFLMRMFTENPSKSWDL